MSRRRPRSRRSLTTSRWLVDDEIDAYVDLHSPECPEGEHRDYWVDDNLIKCGWCGKVVGHR